MHLSLADGPIVLGPLPISMATTEGLSNLQCPGEIAQKHRSKFRQWMLWVKLG